MKAKVGDWVRIMRGGVLVITEVRYIKSAGWDHERYVLDAGGEVDEDDVYEVRARREQEKHGQA